MPERGADDALGQGVVIAVTHAANRGVDSDLCQTFGVFDRQILAAPVAMMDQPASFGRHPLAYRLVQGIRCPAGELPRNSAERGPVIPLLS